MTEEPGRGPSILRTILVGLLGGAISWLAFFLVAGALYGLIRPLGQPAGMLAGLSILLIVTFVMAVALARRVGRGGTLAAAIAGLTNSGLLLSMVLTAEPGDVFNPLLFSWPALSSNVLLAVAGGWVGQRWWRRADGRPLAGAFGKESGLGISVMLLWVVCEFIIRLSGGTGLAAQVGSKVGGDMLALLILLPTAVTWIVRYAAGRGLTQADLGYRRDRQALVAGLLGGVLMFGAVWLTSPIDAWLFTARSAVAAAGVPALAVDAPWVAGLLLLVNGIIVPLCEERVWRGVIQTSLVRAWGIGTGLTITALAFSLKHVIIDGSFGRLITLFGFGLIVGLIRNRWGTTASTVAHCATNLAATALVVAPVLWHL